MDKKLLKILLKCLTDQCDNSIYEHKLLERQIELSRTKIKRLEKRVERLSEDKDSCNKLSKTLNKPDELKALEVNILFRFIFLSKNQFIF